MATSYTSLLGLALPVTGELQGTWGDVVNNYITSYIDASVAGTQTISGSQTAVTLSVTNGTSLTTVGSGATGSAQFQIINCTGNPGGLLTITAPASSRQYIIINATSTNQSVKIVGSGPTTGVTLVAGEKAHVAWNGSDFVKIATQSGNGDFVTVDTTNLEVTNIKAKDGTAALSIADSTGVVSVSANPVLSGGTANGVLYLNASKVATSGTALVFDGTNLGIGTPTPLSVGGYTFTDMLGSTGAQYRVRTSTVDLRVGADATLAFVSSTNSSLWFGANNAEGMRLTSTGLHLGTSFSSISNRLQVDGNAAIGYTTAAPTTGLIVAGNVGIGTDSPGAKLEVNTGSTADATSIVLNNTSNAYPAGYNGSTSIYAKGYAYQSFAQENIGRIQFALDSAFDSGWSSSIRLYTSNSRGSITERARIDSSGTLILRQSSNAANTSVSFNTTVQGALTLDSSGNLGVGTNTPATKLDVSGAASTNSESRFVAKLADTSAVAQGNGGGLVFRGVYTGSTLVDASGIQAYKENATDGNYAYGLAFVTRANGIDLTVNMRLDGSGNLGLGVTPSVWNANNKSVIQLQNTSNIFTRSTGLFATSNFVYNSADDGKFQADGYGVIYQQNQTTGAHVWLNTANNTSGAGATASAISAMTLDASGNLGVGTTSPSSFDASADNLVVGTTSGNNGITIAAGTTGGSTINFADGTAGGAQYAGYIDYQHNGDYMRFGTNGGTERARITSGGDFRVKGAGTAGSTDAFQISGSAPADAARLTSGGSLLVGTTAEAGYLFRVAGGLSQFYATAAADFPVHVWNSAASGDNGFVNFYTDAGATLRGSIDYDRTGGLVRYNTTSDYRAKDIIGPVQNSGQVIDALKVYTGKMKGATIERPMLVAHEAQEHVPYAVTGEKDAVNEDGTPKYQQMDVSSLVPLLLAEIQSLRARVAQLETKGV